jgi:agmatine deiminase
MRHARLVRAGLAATLLLHLAVPAPARPPEIPADRLHTLPEGVRTPRPRVPKTPPPGLEIVNPAEFCRADAMVISWTSWHAQELIDMCLAVAGDDRVLVCVSSASERNQASVQLSAAGVEMANIDFFLTVDGSVWVRDYGPYCAYDDGELAVVDFFYGLGGSYDDIPIYIAQDEGLPWYQSSLLHHGGNHITDGNGMGFFSTNLTAHNPGWSWAQIENEMKDYLGLRSLVVFGTMEGDVTGHCDMFVKLLNDTLFVVGEYAEPGDAVGDDAAFLDDLAASLDALTNLDGRDFEVRRLPMNPIGGIYDYNRTYVNSLILNDRVLVPIYDTELDARALQVYAECLPDHEIVGIDCRGVIQYLGAIHCISSALHHDNPLIILHAPLAAAQFGEAPVLDCRLNPRFTDRDVELHYRPAGGTAEIIAAEFSGGVWRAQLPPLADDIDYWFVARAHTAALTMETALPADAPAVVFTVDVQGETAVGPAPRLARALTARPNPCNPRTVFAFALDRPASVDLRIYDVAGRLQRRLLDGRRLYDDQEVAWDGRDDAGQALPSGIYLARLQAGPERSVMRVSLVR